MQCITMEGWTSIMYLVQDAVNQPAAVLYFFGLVLVGGFFMLNFVLAVIYDNFVEQHEQLETQRLETDFHSFDLNHGGRIDPEELRKVPWNKSRATAERIERLIEQTDWGPTGSLSMEEFGEVFARLDKIRAMPN